MIYKVLSVICIIFPFSLPSLLAKISICDVIIKSYILIKIVRYMFIL